MIPQAILAFIVLLAVIVLLVRTIRVIRQGLVGVVKRLGRFHSVRSSGVTFLVPFVDTLELVDMREMPRTGDRQDAITKDKVSVVVNVTIFNQVVDPQTALYSVSNFIVAMDELSRTTLRAVFAEITLDDALSQREKTNAQTGNGAARLMALGKGAPSHGAVIFVPCRNVLRTSLPLRDLWDWPR